MAVLRRSQTPAASPEQRWVCRCEQRPEWGGALHRRPHPGGWVVSAVQRALALKMRPCERQLRLRPPWPSHALTLLVEQAKLRPKDAAGSHLAGQRLQNLPVGRGDQGVDHQVHGMGRAVGCHIPARGACAGRAGVCARVGVKAAVLRGARGAVGTACWPARGGGPGRGPAAGAHPGSSTVVTDTATRVLPAARLMAAAQDLASAALQSEALRSQSAVDQNRPGRVPDTPACTRLPSSLICGRGGGRAAAGVGCSRWAGCPS